MGSGACDTYGVVYGLCHSLEDRLHFFGHASLDILLVIFDCFVDFHSLIFHLHTVLA